MDQLTADFPDPALQVGSVEVVSSIALRALELISHASEDALSLDLPPVLFTGASEATESLQIAAGSALSSGGSYGASDR